MTSQTSHITLGIDRQSLARTGAHVADRIALGLLDAYGALSTPMRQRGLYKACRAVGAAIWRERNAQIRLAPDAVVSFPASDPYWNRMLLRSYDHEPELARLLRRLAGVDYGFIDAGANIGYWSVFVSSSCGRGKPVLAVEASAPTFSLLAANVAPHSTLVRARHAAILDQSGLTVRLDSAAHEARGIERDATAGEAVSTITIDDLIAQAGWDGRRLVLKLDIEGVEREGLRGARRALAGDALVVFEDHGADRTHALTRHVIEDLGLVVHLLMDDGAIPILAAQALDAHKSDPSKGYNLVAMRADSQWSAILRDVGALR